MNPDLMQPILDAVVDGIITIDRKGNVQSFNPGAEKIFGYARDEVMGKNISVLMPPSYQAEHDNYISNYLETGVAKIICIGREVRGRRKNGDEFPLYLAVNELPAEVGSQNFIGIVRDLTEIKEAERLLKETKNKYRQLVESAPMPILVHCEGVIRFANPAAVEVLGATSKDELLGEQVWKLIPEEDKEELRERIKLYCKNNISLSATKRKFIRLDGSIIDVKISSVIIEFNGEPAALIMFQDVTEETQAQKRLRQEQEKSSAIISSIQDGIAIFQNDCFVFLNETLTEITGLSGNDLTYDEWSLAVHPDDLQLVEEHISRKLDGVEENSTYECRVIRADGSSRQVIVTSRLSTDFPGGPAIIATIKDVTDEKEALADLQQSEGRLRLLANACPSLVSYVGSDRVYRFANKTYEQWYGKAVDEIIGRHVSEVHSAEQYEILDPLITTALSGRRVNFEMEMEDVLSGPRSIQGHLIPDIDREGNVAGYFVFSTDVTELKRREAELRHSQKLEAVGRLTGGISHDFNNLLAVVYGNAVLLRDSLQEGPLDQNEALELVDDILAAAKGGAKLIERLLAFSRRQALEPRHVDVDAIIEKLASMLSRTLGETIDLVVASRPDNRWKAYIDVTQFESAILNLAINGRDAMLSGGTLTIETADVAFDVMYKSSGVEIASGDYVMISVSDTGSGMSPEIRKHAFEPFYTTKDVGEGSGLGLSMVFGFLTESGGHIDLYSEPGFGTSVKMYLPRVDMPEKAKPVVEDKAVSGQGNSPILVVEDDSSVRRTAVRILERLGYSVFEAASGSNALTLLREYSDIRVIFSDVVMPGGMDGYELANLAKELRPDVKILLVSGHLHADPAEDNNIDGGIRLLRKPFTPRELAAELGKLLDDQTGN